jgi:hypothetical protein
MPKQISIDQAAKLYNIMGGNIPLAAVRQDIRGWEGFERRVLTRAAEMSVQDWQKDYRKKLADDYMARAQGYTARQSALVEQDRTARINREAAAANTFYKALEEGDYATARNMIGEYSALGKVYSAKMGARKFKGSQQTSMQAVLGRDVVSEAQSTDWRKTYLSEGLSSVSGYLNAQEVTYLALYGCVITAMLQQILNITNSEITVAQYEQLMDKALNNKNLFTTKQRKRDADGKIMRNAEGKALYKKVDYDRSQFGETYNVVDGASTAKGETEYDIDVYRGALADFYLKELQNLGIDTSGVNYISDVNSLNDYLQDYDVYASVRSGKRQHDYGVYIPKDSMLWSGNLNDYAAKASSNFQDPLNWKDTNLQNANIQGFFIKK